MARKWGYAKRGTRLLCHEPHGHWKTTTFVGGLTSKGIIAPMLLDGAMNGDCFEGYVDQVLSRATKPGDLVILDNLPSHKTNQVRKAFERHKIRFLFLPPYSPDQNPIENAFSKLKRLARSNAKRTIEDLWNSFSSMLRAFSKTECSNYINHCGYIAV